VFKEGGLGGGRSPCDFQLAREFLWVCKETAHPPSDLQTEGAELSCRWFAGGVPSGGERRGSAKPGSSAPCVRNLSVQRPLCTHRLLWGHKCGFRLLCLKLSANRSDLLVSLALLCVFQLHAFTQLPRCEEGVGASAGRRYWLGE